MLAESHPIIRRLLRFIALPYCYFKLVNWKECTSSRLRVLKDLLYIFFKLKYYPDNYGPCRLWEKDRNEWTYYYGSSYNSYPRNKLRKEVQTFERQIIFNDKFICEQFLSFGLDMPHTFGMISANDNYREEIKTIFDNNKRVVKLIIKPVMGHAGLGIILAIRTPNGIKIKSSKSEVDLAKFELKEQSIIQEIIDQDDSISKISSSSVNTIRIVTLHTKSKEIIVLSATMRFGVGDAFVDNWSAGGIAVGVNHSTGKLRKIAYDKFGNQYTEHPVSKVVFLDFQIPRWEQILQIAYEVQKLCPFYKLLGMDVALSKDGPILIEVNANPDLIFQEQTSGPLLKDEKILTEFAKYDLLINDFQKNLLLNP